MDKAITETIGVDVGDRRSSYCVLDQATGEIREEGQVESTPRAMGEFFARFPGARAVLEAGGHSPWVSRIAAQRCAQALVANPRALAFIYGNHRKSDRVDARALAKVGRLDTSLLSPVVHRGAQAQADLALVRLRRSLVEARTKLVNALRGTLKSMGHRLPKRAARCMGEEQLPEIPPELRQVVKPLLQAIGGLTTRIRAYDKRIEALSTKTYKPTAVLRQVDGVGVLTAFAYVLTVEDSGRLRVSRDAGAYFGLVPRRAQSGAVDKQLGISKQGDELVRTLLVQCAHRILGPFGEDSALRRHGLALATRGGPAAKKRAVIAVARKLAVLLHRLWVTGEAYEPLRGVKSAQRRIQPARRKEQEAGARAAIRQEFRPRIRVRVIAADAPPLDGDTEIATPGSFGPQHAPAPKGPSRVRMEARAGAEHLVDGRRSGSLDKTGLLMEVRLFQVPSASCFCWVSAERRRHVGWRPSLRRKLRGIQTHSVLGLVHAVARGRGGEVHAQRREGSGS